MTLRAAALSEDELRAISALHGTCFSRPWSESEIRTLLNSSGAFAFVCARYNTLRGFVIARVAADEGEILSLAVAHGERLRGIGRSLVRAAAAHAFACGARKLFLEVARTNDPANALYRSLGFEPVGMRKRYYEEPAGAGDALTLRADLPIRIRQLGDSP
ncbi:MAG: GNAT family N-acetyltransferase [Alphaproteobacteria bacterium]|nr:GNAT family N-acetyltransferase [Alphaproteobacteria bacterium]